MLPLWLTRQCVGGLPGTSRKARYRCSQLERGSDSETSANDRKCQKTCWSNLHQGGCCGYCQYQTRVNTRQCLVHTILRLLTRHACWEGLEWNVLGSAVKKGNTNCRKKHVLLPPAAGSGKNVIANCGWCIVQRTPFRSRCHLEAKDSMQQSISLERIAFMWFWLILFAFITCAV